MIIEKTRAKSYAARSRLQNGACQVGSLYLICRTPKENSAVLFLRR